MSCVAERSASPNIYWYLLADLYARPARRYTDPALRVVVRGRQQMGIGLGIGLIVRRLVTKDKMDLERDGQRYYVVRPVRPQSVVLLGRPRPAVLRGRPLPAAVRVGRAVAREPFLKLIRSDCPGESRRHCPTEPDVTVSRHPTPVVLAAWTWSTSGYARRRDELATCRSPERTGRTSGGALRSSRRTAKINSICLPGRSISR